MIALAPGRALSPALWIVWITMVEGHTGGWASLGSRAAALAMLALAVVPASAGAMPVVGGAAVAPQRIAIVVFENKDYDNSLDPTDRRFVVSNPAAPYINQTVIPESLSLVPTPFGCDHPPAMLRAWQSRRADPACFSRIGTTSASASGRLRPSIRGWTTGTDSNVRDRSFPSRLNPQQPEGGIVGCTPGHNDTSGPVYDLFGYMEATGVPFDAYQEDYPGGPTDCSTLQYSDGAAADPMFYARKHSPLLLTWSQAPDALVVNDGPGGAEDFSPPAAPTPAACKEHVRDFPGNVPNATTQAQRNFTGNEQFGRVTFVVPSMCHSGHDSNRVCLGSDTDGRGGIEGIDRWLELNLDGLRRDVGRNGVVILTFDEDHTADGAGVVAPMYTGIVPGISPGWSARCARGPRL